MAGQVAVCCDMCGRGFHTDKDVVLVESPPPAATTAITSTIQVAQTSASASAVFSSSSATAPLTSGLGTTSRSGIDTRLDTGLGLDTELGFETTARLDGSDEDIMQGSVTPDSTKTRAGSTTGVGTNTRADTRTRARSPVDGVAALAMMLQYHASQVQTNKQTNTHDTCTPYLYVALFFLTYS